jgi:putative membrane protein
MMTMAGYETSEFWGWWWIFPIAMMILCFFMMRGRMCCGMGRNDSQDVGHLDRSNSSDSARETLDKRYALGEINKEEYEEKKRDISC